MRQVWSEYRCAHALPPFHQQLQIQQSPLQLRIGLKGRFCLLHTADPKSTWTKRSEQHASPLGINVFQGTAVTPSCCRTCNTITLHTPGYPIRMLLNECPHCERMTPWSKEKKQKPTCNHNPFLKWLQNNDFFVFGCWNISVFSLVAEDLYYSCWWMIKGRCNLNKVSSAISSHVLSLTQNSSASLWKISPAPRVHRDRKHSQHTLSIFLPHQIDPLVSLRRCTSYSEQDKQLRTR